MIKFSLNIYYTNYWDKISNLIREQYTFSLSETTSSIFINKKVIGYKNMIEYRGTSNKNTTSYHYKREWIIILIYRSPYKL